MSGYRQDRPPRWMAALLRRWFRVEVAGEPWLESAGPVVFVSNHLSAVDAPLIAALARRSCLVAAPRRPPMDGIAGWLWRKAGLEWIDATDPEAVRGGLRRVREGSALLVFPEGRMSPHGALMKVYADAARLIDAARAPIVPLHIDGLELSRWSPEKTGQRRLWRPRVHLQVGHPQETLRPEGRRDGAAVALRDLMERQRFEALNRWRTIGEALQATARRLGPGQVAIEDPRGTALSLRQVAIGSAALGARLRRHTAHGEIVGVLLPGVASIPAVLGALWREGRVAAMLNPTLGPGPAEAALNAAGIRRILCSRAFVEQGKLQEVVARLETAGARMIWIEDVRAEIGALGRLRALLSHRPGPTGRGARDQPAVVLFTSGTEGFPKAVLLSHGNLLANVAQLRARTDVSPADRVLTALPLFHALGLTAGLLFPLICGARLMVYPTPLHYKVVPELAYVHQATVIVGTDTFFSGWGRRADPHDFISVRAPIAGAEPVKPATRALWAERFGVRIYEGYGATEAAPVIAVNIPTDVRDGTVGRFLPAIEHRLEDVPGIPGARLWVRGPNVMMGYMRADNPGVLEPVLDGWYDTGDAVSIDGDGFMTLEGRIKRFAKIGGEMVSLTAVERLAAMTWPEAGVAAVAEPDTRKGERVVLALAGATPDRDALRKKARAEGMSELLLPAAIHAVDEIPLLASGKTDYPSLTQQLALEQRRAPHVA